MTRAVEHALFRRATGYSFESERIVCRDGTIIRVPHEVHLPPSAAAARFWLSGRGARSWREPPSRHALYDLQRAECDQRVWRCDIAAHEAWQRGMRGQDLQRHVLDLFGVTDERLAEPAKDA